MNKNDLTVRVARWALLLEEFDYGIEHIPGTKMKQVDVISRYPVNTIDVIEEITPKIRQAHELDQKIKTERENKPSCFPKSSAKEGFLHPLSKDDFLFQTLHIDHLRPLESTHKNYKHILAILDSFTKFMRLYPVKTTSTEELITKLEQRTSIFGNSELAITDKGTCFTSKEFKVYCETENINHHAVKTGLPRSNRQIGRTNEITTSIIAKLSIKEPTR